MASGRSRRGRWAQLAATFFSTRARRRLSISHFCVLCRGCDPRFTTRPLRRLKANRRLSVLLFDSFPVVVASRFHLFSASLPVNGRLAHEQHGISIQNLPTSRENQKSGSANFLSFDGSRRAPSSFPFCPPVAFRHSPLADALSRVR